MPQHRATFTITQNWDDISMFVRANYFGEYFAVHADDDCLDGCWNEIADSSFTFDAEVSYFINESFKAAVGANNIFDQEAQKLLNGYLMTIEWQLNDNRMATECQWRSMTPSPLMH